MSRHWPIAANVCFRHAHMTTLGRVGGTLLSRAPKTLVRYTDAGDHHYLLTDQWSVAADGSLDVAVFHSC